MNRKSGRHCGRRSIKQVLVLALAFVLVIGASVGGTLAWLTAKTPAVTNTFTSAELFGTNGSLSLWEHQAVDTDKDGKYTLNKDKEVLVNSYDILPGVDIPKDPTVDVVNLEEHAYLFIRVTGLSMGKGLTAAVNATNWQELDEANYPGVYVFKGNYNNGKPVVDNVIPATDDAMISFTAEILAGNTIDVAENYSGTADDISLSFTAYMVQATGFDSAAAAWEASDYDTNH